MLCEEDRVRPRCLPPSCLYRANLETLHISDPDFGHKFHNNMWRYGQCIVDVHVESCVYCKAPTNGACDCGSPVCSDCLWAYRHCPSCDWGVVEVFEKAQSQQPDPTVATVSKAGVEVLQRLLSDISLHGGLEALLLARAEAGYKTYGEYLTTNNGRCFVSDCIQELADAVMYLYGAKMERNLTPAETQAIAETLDTLKEILDAN